MNLKEKIKIAKVIGMLLGSENADIVQCEIKMLKELIGDKDEDFN